MTHLSEQPEPSYVIAFSVITDRLCISTKQRLPLWTQFVFEALSAEFIFGPIMLEAGRVRNTAAR